MRELLSDLRDWHTAGTPFALATVVAVRGSAPRAPGAVMAVSATGAVAGSVSGGCVESDVYEVAAEALSTGRTLLRTYGISDDEAFGVGLTCGGTIEVLVRPYVEESDRAALRELLGTIAAGEPVALATVVSGAAPAGAHRTVLAGRAAGSLGDEGLDAAVTDDARGLLAQGSPAPPATARTASAACRTSPSSFRRTPPRPACSSSGPSTTPRPPPGSGPSWATG